MLKNRRGRKPKIVLLEEAVWEQSKIAILDSIKEGIDILKTMIRLELDEYVCAAFYTFITEEFGKLIILSKAPKMNNSRREVKYASE
jgi:hypothetical protein